MASIETPTQSIYIGDITFDVLNTSEMARFWATVLHYKIQEIRPDFASIIHPNGQSPRCCFQKVTNPKTVKNRVHLDLYALDMNAEVERLIQLGAQKVVTRRDEGIVWTVMLDIEGNEFCVQPPINY